MQKKLLSEHWALATVSLVVKQTEVDEKTCYNYATKKLRCTSYMYHVCQAWLEQECQKTETVCLCVFHGLEARPETEIGKAEVGSRNRNNLSHHTEKRKKVKKNLDLAEF